MFFKINYNLINKVLIVTNYEGPNSYKFALSLHTAAWRASVSTVSTNYKFTYLIFYKYQFCYNTMPLLTPPRHLIAKIYIIIHRSRVTDTSGNKNCS